MYMKVDPVKKNFWETLVDAVRDTIADPDPIGGSGIPNIEKFRTIFADVEQEGREQGYERAAEEYEEAFRRVEQEYKETSELLDGRMEEQKTLALKLQTRLEQLESRKDTLENRLEEKTERVAECYDLSYAMVSGAVGGMNVIANPPRAGLVDVLYHYKNRKRQEAEEEAYREARRLYREKIEELSENLKRLKEKGTSEIQKMIQLVEEMLREIADLEAKVAEMEIALRS